jgi:hypothetical protein
MLFRAVDPAHIDRIPEGTKLVIIDANARRGYAPEYYTFRRTHMNNLGPFHQRVVDDGYYVPESVVEAYRDRADKPADWRGTAVG